MTGRMDDGFSTTMTFAEDATVKFYEKEVTPPSVEAGGENDTTTMLNTTWRTKAPKKLKTLGDAGLTVAYDPAVYDDVIAMIGVNQKITIKFPDDSTLKFYGWIDVFTPNSIVEGEQPTADVTIVCGNQSTSGGEAAPLYSAS